MRSIFCVHRITEKGQACLDHHVDLKHRQKIEQKDAIKQNNPYPKKSRKSNPNQRSFKMLVSTKRFGIKNVLQADNVCGW